MADAALHEPPVRRVVVLCTHIVVFRGPVRVSQRMEPSLFFCLFVVSVLLLFGQTLPLGRDDNTVGTFADNDA